MDENIKPNAEQFVAEKMVTEMERQGMNRTQMAKTLGWPISRVRTRLDGKKITMGDCAQISLALDMDVARWFDGMSSTTVSLRQY